MYVPAIVCVSVYFEKYRSLATGIAVCGSGMGTFLLAPVTEIFVSEYSWRGAFLLVGALMFNCVVFGILFRPLDPPPPRRTASPEAAPAVARAPSKARPRSAAVDDRPPGMTAYASQPVLADRGRRSSHSGAGVMYNRDVFYSGSLHNVARSYRPPPPFTPRSFGSRPRVGSGSVRAPRLVVGAIPRSISFSGRSLDRNYKQIVFRRKVTSVVERCRNRFVLLKGHLEYFRSSIRRDPA